VPGNNTIDAIADGGSRVTWPRYTVRRLGIAGRSGALLNRGPPSSRSSDGNDTLVSLIFLRLDQWGIARSRYVVAAGTIY